jgi:acyl-coenzyme A thioesterase PaaI-like protein
LTSEAAATAVVRATESTFEFSAHNCFGCGTLNSHGMQLDLHIETGRCWTELTLQRHFEGWQGIAHGGIVCTVLDEVMAWSLVGADNWGVTAKLSVAFKRPIRVGQRIRAEGLVTKERRRLVATAGTVVDTADGTVLASADALYVAATEERKRELQQRYGFRMRADAPELGAGG